jgi:hypothetical protein
MTIQEETERRFNTPEHAGLREALGADVADAMERKRIAKNRRARASRRAARERRLRVFTAVMEVVHRVRVRVVARLKIAR